MAKLAVVTSLLLALLALSEATTYTTITTTVVEEDTPRGRSCSQQVQTQSLQQCSRYLTQRGSGTPYEIMEVVEDDVNPEAGMSRQLKQCCQELRIVDQQCRCEAIKEVVKRQQQEQGQGQGMQHMQQVVQKAQNLPKRCNFRQPQQCSIPAVWF